MYDTFPELLSSLKFLSKVKKDEKINIREMFIQPNNWTTSLSRSLYKVDNRKNTLHFIQYLILSTFTLSKQLLNSNNNAEHVMADSLLKAVINSKNGIKNLKYTYQDDIHFACILDTIMEHIDVQILQIKESYEDWNDLEINNDIESV